MGGEGPILAQLLFIPRKTNCQGGFVQGPRVVPNTRTNGGGGGVQGPHVVPDTSANVGTQEAWRAQTLFFLPTGNISLFPLPPRPLFPHLTYFPSSILPPLPSHVLSTFLLLDCTSFRQIHLFIFWLFLLLESLSHPLSSSTHNIPPHQVVPSSPPFLPSSAYSIFYSFRDAVRRVWCWDFLLTSCLFPCSFVPLAFCWIEWSSLPLSSLPMLLITRGIKLFKNVVFSKTSILFSWKALNSGNLYHHDHICILWLDFITLRFWVFDMRC